MKEKKVPQLFRSRVAKIVKDEVKRNGIPKKVTPQSKPSYFETPKENKLGKISEVIDEDPFEKLNNVYYHDPNKSQNPSEKKEQKKQEISE